METTTHNGITRAVDDAIERVDIDTTPLAYRYPRPYGERPTRYMVTFRGETKRRRVYATPLGNVFVFYVKTRGEQVMVETALEVALHTGKAREE